MSVKLHSARSHAWIARVTALCFVLGLLLSASLQTVSNVRQSGAGGRFAGVPAPAPSPGEARTLKDRETEVATLREQVTKLQSAMAEGDGQAKTLNEDLKKTKALAGLTEVEGPGIRVRLTDSRRRPSSSRAFEADKYIIHDVDLQQVVNELGASGAEAIAVNNQRLVGRTAIRCVGPTIQVNGVPITAPFVIVAIGHTETLANGLALLGGVLDGIQRFDPAMASVTRSERIVIPAYAGGTELKYARTTGEASSGKDRS
jgi:uncharacterized protein YlxW (UPF0749 family)